MIVFPILDRVTVLYPSVYKLLLHPYPEVMHFLLVYQESLNWQVANAVIRLLKMGLAYRRADFMFPVNNNSEYK